MIKWVAQIFFCLIIISSCQSEKKVEQKENEIPLGNIASAYSDYEFPFSINNPQKNLPLSEFLTEISGLGMHKSGQFILAHNDEKGIVYFLDPSTGQIQKSLDLGINGDFEGIEMVDNTIFLVKSNGDLFANRILEDDEIETIPFDTGLKKKADVEGLGFLEERNLLILACKGNTGNKDEKNFFGFDINAGSLLPQPLISINEEGIRNFLTTHSQLPKKQIKKISKDFSPSGIAVHPITGDWYILSSVGKLLFVLAPSGDLLHIEKLDPEIYPQPEGISFSTKSSELYIASEGKDQKGMLYIFQSNNY